MVWPTLPLTWSSDFQNDEKDEFLLLKPPGLWYFNAAVPGAQNTRNMLNSKTPMSCMDAAEFIWAAESIWLLC